MKWDGDAVLAIARRAESHMRPGLPDDLVPESGQRVDQLGGREVPWQPLRRQN